MHTTHAVRVLLWWRSPTACSICQGSAKQQWQQSGSAIAFGLQVILAVALAMHTLNAHPMCCAGMIMMAEPSSLLSPSVIREAAAAAEWSVGAHWGRLQMKAWAAMASLLSFRCTTARSCSVVHGMSNQLVVCSGQRSSSDGQAQENVE